MGRISEIIPSLYYDKQNDLIRFKGTPLSLDIFLNSIDVDEHKLYTFFRDAEGNLVEEKPEGSPFQDSSGLWRNIRTHYFDLDIRYGVDHYQTWTEWHTDFLRSMNIWLTKAKPFHSELRNLRVFLQGISAIQHFVGTATGQAYHHDIAPAKPVPSASTQLITAGTGIMHRSSHEVRIIWSTGCNVDVGLKVAHGVSQGQHHEVAFTGTSHPRDLQALSIAGAVQQKPQHDIDFMP